MALPPWLNPPNFLGAMSQGANLGLEIRRMDQASEERAAQLALERDKIALAEQAQAVRLEESRQRAAEALRTHNALQQYRMANLAETRRNNEMRAATALSKAAMQEAAMEKRDAARQALAERRLKIAEGEAAQKLPPAVESQRRILEDKLKSLQDARNSALNKTYTEQDKDGVKITPESQRGEAMLRIDRDIDATSKALQSLFNPQPQQAPAVSTPAAAALTATNAPAIPMPSAQPTIKTNRFFFDPTTGEYRQQ